MPQSLRLMLPLLLIPLACLAACATAPISEAPAVVNACNAIHLPPKLNDADRAKLADEIDANPGAIWVSVLVGESRVNRDVMACQDAGLK